MIFQLVYQSTATWFLSPDELLAILERSRANNARLQISGMLLYHGGRFLQLLEGDEAQVRERYEVIAADERHKWVSLVMTGPNGARDFPDWMMGFRDLDQSTAPPTAGPLFSTAPICRRISPPVRATCATSSSTFGNGPVHSPATSTAVSCSRVHRTLCKTQNKRTAVTAIFPPKQTSTSAPGVR